MLSAQKAGLSLSRQGKWPSLTKPLVPTGQVYPRYLFELHAARDARLRPAPLILDEIEGGVSDKNKDWHTTSQDLIRALGDVGQEYATHNESAGRLDISYTDALRVTTDRAQALQEIAAAKDSCGGLDSTPQQKRQRHLKDVLVRYLVHVEPQLSLRTTQGMPSSGLDQALTKTFNHSVRKWLQKRGWDVEDLMDWTWILKSASPELATMRFKCIAHVPKEGSCLRIPNTIFLFLLRRRNVSPQGISSLLQYAWSAMESMSSAITGRLKNEADAAEGAANHPSATKSVLSPKEDPAGMTEDMFILMIIRLLRHAQRAWPAANENIINLFCRYVNGLNFHVDPAVDPARLAFVYNTMLSLLGRPTSLEPYVSTMYQQRAQFVILHRMNDFDPPLVVDKRGYRAFTQVQLMHKKTLREREWAMLKSKSWPPWKEDRMGVHSVIGPESGISRASQSLRDAEEAGYGAEAWQASASLIAGWDVDGSPTIQTRRAALWSDAGNKPQDQDAIIWASRIRATRSLREAWAMFQGFRDAKFITPTACADVYLAMFEKMAAKVEKSESLEHSLSTDSHLPGDGLEIFPDPHINAVYVRTTPPTFDQFYDVLMSDGVHVKGRLLNFLITHASSVTMIISILEAADLPALSKQALLSNADTPKSASRTSALQEIRRALFEAFVVSISKFRSHAGPPDESGQTESIIDSQPFTELMSRPFTHALNLMLLRQHSHPRAWNALLKANANARPSDPHEQQPRSIHRRSVFRAWNTCLQLLHHMETLDVNVDLDGLHEILRTFERAATTAQRSIDSETGGARKDAAKTLLETGLSKMKILFKRVVAADETQEAVPFHLRNEKAEMDQQVEGKINQAAQNADTLEQENPVEAAQDKQRDSRDEEVYASPQRAFLPPGCLLPRLLAIPRPAFLHQMIRCLGFARDYPGLLDLVEWMALFAKELKMQADEQRNGARMTRRCIVATRVMLERSWEEPWPADEHEVPVQESGERYFSSFAPVEMGERPKTASGRGEEKRLPRTAASKEVRDMVRGLIESNPAWGGWASDQEVQEYVSKGVFA